MIVITDSTSLISLARISKFDLLRELFGEIIVPQAVFDEVVHRGRNRPGQKEVENSPWIKAQAISDRLAVEALETDLGRGEAEVIVLAREINANLVLLDDGKARSKARALGLEVTGTIGVLLHAARAGRFRFIPIFESLLASGFRLKKTEYERILELVRREGVQ